MLEVQFPSSAMLRASRRRYVESCEPRNDCLKGRGEADLSTCRPLRVEEI